MDSHAAGLTARELTHRFGMVVALDGVTLAVAPSECVALVGESGSGKSTLLRCFNRLVTPDTGQVLVDGHPVDGVPIERLRRSIGYVPQHGGLLPHWTAGRNAGLVPALAHLDSPSERGRAALELVGLAPAQYADRYPHELSGGQRQRVALARAVAARPGIILLDEPFGALDAISRNELQAVFADLRDQLGLTTILVTHDLAEAARLGDRIVVMRRGRVEQDATPSAVFRAPASPYVEHLVTSARAAAHGLTPA